MLTEGKLASTLKVIVNDIGFDVDGTLVQTPNAPTRAYLISSDLSTTINRQVGSYPSDFPGAVFVVSQVSPSMEILAEGLEKQRNAIGFNRGNGGGDIRLDVDLSVLGQQEGGPSEE